MEVFFMILLICVTTVPFLKTYEGIMREMQDSRNEIEAAGIAQGLMANILQYPWDECVVGAVVGPEGWLNWDPFSNPYQSRIGFDTLNDAGIEDDIDDFDGYSEVMDGYTVNITVRYVNALLNGSITLANNGGLGTILTDQTDFKQVTITCKWDDNKRKISITSLAPYN